MYSFYRWLGRIIRSKPGKLGVCRYCGVLIEYDEVNCWWVHRENGRRYCDITLAFPDDLSKHET